MTSHYLDLLPHNYEVSHNFDFLSRNYDLPERDIYFIWQKLIFH